MAVSGYLPSFVHIVLAILWIGLFFQNKRKHTVNIIHILLLVFALAILLKLLYKWVNIAGFGEIG